MSINTDSNAPLVNKVAQSGLLTFDLEDLYPGAEVASFDLKDYLFMAMILKEKDFREALKVHDWTQYQGKVLTVFCSADAIIPVWAYMLVATYAAPHVLDVVLATPEQWVEQAFLSQIAGLDLEKFAGKRIVVKGCSGKPVPPAAYLAITKRLQPIVQSLFFGEPCSTVPVYKKAVGG